MLDRLVDGLLAEQRDREGGATAEQRDREGGATVIYECRRCGTTLDANASACPYCGPTEVVRFEF